jgi:hypothetical protein
MPSRGMMVLIVVAWLGVLGYVIHRDVWPRYFGDTPPNLQIDLVDEATQRAPTRWTIYRQDKSIGTLTSQMIYEEPTDSFQFVNTYSKLQIEAGTTTVITIAIPRLTSTVTVSRAGQLRAQSMTGELSVLIGPLELGNAGAEVSGTVSGGELRGRCQLRYPLTAKNPNIDRELDPVPVPEGQVLNPLMPVNRLQGIIPGKRWVIRQVDPMKDAVDTLIRELLKDSKVKVALPEASTNELIAEVLNETVEWKPRSGPAIPCRVIEYRSERVNAKTWVSIPDGRVLRQEAGVMGEQLRFERQE